MRSSGARLVSGMTDNTIGQIQDILARGIAEGKGIPDLARSLRNGLDILAPSRARAIARTEVVRASNVGTFEAGRYLEEETGVRWGREWIPYVDKHSRPHHADMQGVVVGPGESFRLDGPNGTFLPWYPCDASLPASECVNCRCTFDFVPLE